MPRSRGRSSWHNVEGGCIRHYLWTCTRRYAPHMFRGCGKGMCETKVGPALRSTRFICSRVPLPAAIHNTTSCRLPCSRLPRKGFMRRKRLQERQLNGKTARGSDSTTKVAQANTNSAASLTIARKLSSMSTTLIRSRSSGKEKFPLLVQARRIGAVS